MAVANPKRESMRADRGTGRRNLPALPAMLALLCAAMLALGIAASRASTASAASAAAPRLSEVMTKGDASVYLSDWIEIENATDGGIDLSGCALVTESKPGKGFAFPGGVTLEPGERLVVYCDGGAARADGRLHAPFKLPAAGETILLLNPHGVSVDSVQVPPLKAGEVYCRDGAGQWQVSTQATPGEANRIAEAGSGASAGNSIEPGAVEISEAMSRNVTFFKDANGGRSDYVEVHNTTDETVNLAGWALSDDGDNPRKWVFPSVELPPDGCLAVRCDGVSRKDDPGELHAGFRLNRDGETLWLSDATGVLRDAVTLPALAADAAYSRTAFGWVTNAAPTPGAPNTAESAEIEADAFALDNDVGVYITELAAASSAADDWIELYNASEQAVDLSGFGLSDNAAKPRKWQFPSGTVLQPGQYLGIFAGGTSGSSAALRTDFSLAADGGYSVTLCDASGRVFDRLFVPQQYGNISYGRMASLRGTRYFKDPTPGAGNAGEGCLGRAPQPEYSVRGGLYASGTQLQVTLSVPEGYRAYYTTDCTDPTQSSTPYTGPIAVTGTTILRTRVYREGYLESVMDSQSYLFDVKNGGGAVYVMSLVTDPYNLYSDEAGIFAKGPNALSKYPYGSLNKGANFWMDWEREAHIEVFEPDGTPILSQECGTKIHGVHSRPMEKKPLKVIARSEYGSNRFQASLFTRRNYTQYQSFLLRTGSQDWDRTHMRDVVLQQLAADTPMMYQEYEIGVLYLNGEYWGHYNLRERVNTASICQWEGWEGDEDALDLVRGNDTVMQGSNDTMEKLLKWLSSHNANSDEAYSAIDSLVDIDSYLEYIAIEMYTGNTDTLNIKRYRNPKKDGKWRWVMFDLDCGFDIDTNSVARWLDPEGMGRAKNTDNRLFVACMKNARIRDRFLTYLGQKMATTYTAEFILGRIEEYYNVAKAITADDLERWGLKQKTYNQELQNLVNYTRNRPGRMLQFLKYSENLHLTREEMERYFGDAILKAGLTYDRITKP